MKEIYFTSDMIQEKAHEMLQRLEVIRKREEQVLQPGRSALLVLDMQRYFLEPHSHAYIPSAPAIIPGLQSLISAYADGGFPVIFTRHVNSAQDAGMMATWWRDMIDPHDPLSEIIHALDQSKGSVIEKCQYDAFYGSQLGLALKEASISQLVIGGVMTHLCCETTARSAFMRGFRVFFSVDGTATYNEDFHNASLLNLAHGFATPVLVGEVLSALRGQHAA